MALARAQTTFALNNKPIRIAAVCDMKFSKVEVLDETQH